MTKFKEMVRKYGEFGVVEQIRYPVALVQGLPGARIGEVLYFEGGQTGQVTSLTLEYVEVLLFSRQPVDVGDEVARSSSPLTFPMSKDLLGSVVTPLGEYLLRPLKNKKAKISRREVDVRPLDISHRRSVEDQLLTGVSAVDLLIPIGKGQRELVVGDRKTGKSSFLLTVMKRHASEGGVVIYSCIGMTLNEVKKVVEFAEKEGIRGKVVFVVASSEDSPSLIYHAPFSAMAVAEYFRDEVGGDILVILDNLSTHAQFYREISLLSGKFPGRDSYPGDIFYTHARLLERAGKFEKGSITCLPVAQTTQNDLTDYIVSNLIGITDGHILFDVNAFSKGRRPAINLELSVTRVGRQTQSPLFQEANRTLLAFLTSRYDEAVKLSHFGAELNDRVLEILDKGEKYFAFLNQRPDELVPVEVQLAFVGMIWLNFFRGDDTVKIPVYRQIFTKRFAEEKKAHTLVSELSSLKDFNDLIEVIESKKEDYKSLCRVRTR